MKCYKGKINTNFYTKKISKEDSQYNCLTVVLIDSVLRTGKNLLSTGVFTGIKIYY